MLDIKKEILQVAHDSQLVCSCHIQESALHSLGYECSQYLMAVSLSSDAFAFKLKLPSYNGMITSYHLLDIPGSQHYTYSFTIGMFVYCHFPNTLVLHV